MVRLRNQENESVVEVDIKNNIGMHDHVRDMVRNIVEEKSTPFSIWQQQMTDYR